MASNQKIKREKMSKTKIVSLPKENLFAYANERISVKKVIPTNQSKRFVVGNKYSLKATECEGFTMRTNIYELVHILETVNDIEFKSLVMKPIDIGSTMIYSLTKQDCSNIGVEFQEGLQLFPMELDWKLEDGKVVKEIDFNREFDDDDLSTYPVDENSKTVEHIVIRMTGFKQVTDTLLRTPTHTTINLKEFLKNIYISYNEDCEPFENASKLSLNGRVVTYSLVATKHGIPMGWIVDNDSNSIFIEINTQIRDMSNDKITGIDPKFLEGKNINDLIHVSWEEREVPYEDIRRRTDRNNSWNATDNTFSEVIRDLNEANASYKALLNSVNMFDAYNRRMQWSI